jgi:hypothetical protein
MLASTSPATTASAPRSAIVFLRTVVPPLLFVVEVNRGEHAPARVADGQTQGDDLVTAW